MEPRRTDRAALIPGAPVWPTLQAAATARGSALPGTPRALNRPVGDGQRTQLSPIRVAGLSASSSAKRLWFKERVNRNGGRLKKTTIVALAPPKARVSGLVSPGRSGAVRKTPPRSSPVGSNRIARGSTSPRSGAAGRRARASSRPCRAGRGLNGGSGPAPYPKSFQHSDKAEPRTRVSRRRGGSAKWVPSGLDSATDPL